MNNAGFGTFGPFHTLDLDTETREIQLNVVALVRLTHAAAARDGRSAGSGGILNVSSLAGFQPGPSNATYGATKAFVTSFTEAVHEEMKGTGVSVTVLCPGFTRTEFQARAERAGGATCPASCGRRPTRSRRAGLDALAKNQAVAIPGDVNKVLGTFSARHAARDHRAASAARCSSARARSSSLPASRDEPVHRAAARRERRARRGVLAERRELRRR